ncbi:hypothetical protein COP2_022422 [Malus domestica]
MEEVEEVEEDLLWIQEKALDVVEFTGSVTQAIPRPRVGTSSLPWILALPLAYAEDRRTLGLVLLRDEEIVFMIVKDLPSQKESRAKAASVATTDNSPTRWAHFGSGSGSVFFLLKTPSPSSPAPSSSCFRFPPREEWVVLVERIFQKKRK